MDKVFLFYNRTRLYKNSASTKVALLLCSMTGGLDQWSTVFVGCSVNTGKPSVQDYFVNMFIIITSFVWSKENVVIEPFRTLWEIYSLNNIEAHKGFMVGHLNIRSLLPKIDQVRHELLNGSLDVVGFSETWMHDKLNSNLIEQSGYNLERQDKGLLIKGEEVCVFILRRSWTIPNTIVLLIMVTVNFVQSQCQKDILMVLVYRPPSENNVMFIDLLRDYIDKLYVASKMDIIILGDFNINYLNNDVHTKRLVNFQNELFLKQIVDGPTRCDEASKTMIDLIFTSIRF